MIDIAAVPSMPADITFRVTSREQLERLHAVLQRWAERGADLGELPAIRKSLAIPEENMRVAAGGSAANVLRVAQQWGSQTLLAGVVGTDTAGEQIQRQNAAAGIDLSLVHVQKERATPIYVMFILGSNVTTTALIPRKQRVTSLFQGSEAEWVACAERLQELAPRILHINTANQKLLALLDKLAGTTRFSLNLNDVPETAAAADKLVRLLRRAHLIITSDVFVDTWQAYLAPLDLPAISATEERCAILLEALFQLAPNLELGVVTRAERGLIAQTCGAVPFILPAYRPIEFVDPTGAGDVFTGTMLAQLLEAQWEQKGLPGDLPVLLARSTIAAGLNCEHLGATSKIPTRAEVDERLEVNRQHLVPRDIATNGRQASLRVPRHFVEAVSPMAHLITGILAAVQQTLGRNNFSALVADFDQTKTCVAVGSGSSYSVACALERLAARMLPTPYTVKAYRPGEYLSLGRSGETVICITQHGNPDIAAAADQARRLGVKPFVITARKSRWTQSFDDQNVFLHADETVSSFVNVRGTCAAVALIIEWMAQQARQTAPSFEAYEDRYDLACEELAGLSTVWSAAETMFVALASGLMLAPLHEFDLKAAEAGITAENYELKGWTHGRYQRVWRNQHTRQYAFITLETPADAPVVEGIALRFRQLRRPVPIYRLHTTDDALGLWQHFVHVMLLIERLAPSDPTALSVPSALSGINRRIPLLPRPGNDIGS